jgi:4-amino-4-deoxy-L-arabinose transferase-like glycosyltransferase
MNLRWSLWKLCLFGCLVAGLHWMGTGGIPLVDRDEPRFAQATRELVESGDWIVPTFNGLPRYDKPPLIYWAQAISVHFLGPSAAAVRLPSVLSAALAAVVLVLWARRAAGDAAGWMAGCLFATSLQVAIHARLAVADMLLVLWVSLSAWALWEVARRRREGWIPGPWDWVFWGALGCGFLTKGPVAWFPMLVAVLSGPRPRLLRVLQGSAVVLLVVGGWGIPALIRTRGEFLMVGLGHHVLDRYAGSLDGHGSGTLGRYLLSLPFYAVTIWPSFFPASRWLPWWIRNGWRGGETSLLGRQCRAGFLLVFAVFTLGNTKLPHYLLPALPWVCVGVAEAWVRQKRPDGSWIRTTAVMAVLEAVLALALARSGFVRSMAPAGELLADADRWPPATELATTHYREPSLVWSYRSGGRPPVQFLEFESSAAFLNQPGPRACVLTADEFERWDGREARRVHGSPVIRSVNGWNPVHGKRVHLVLVRFER